jgi:D-alanine-D-alanine ligase
MRIGLAFDLSPPASGIVHASDPTAAALPDDWYEEFDSPVTVEAVAGALRRRGHEVVLLGNGRDLLRQFLAQPPELVFNFAEGEGTSRSREARVPAICEMLGIAHTGSDPATLSIALDKDWARQLVSRQGVRVPAAGLVHPGPGVGVMVVAPPTSYPLILKPAWEGSSKGIRQTCLIEQPEELQPTLERLLRDYRQPVLIEEFIAGDELTVGLIGNDPPRVLGIMRVVPNEPTERFVYSVEVKRDFRRQVRYECPPPLASEVLARVEQAALSAWTALGCRDLARIDFRLRDGEPYFLEANPLPGLNPTSSDLVIMAGLIGVSHDELIGRILDAALARCSA